jgi:NAD(P)-dependent dehydrogenase (short-subunit alcohol dehydrogenase family)
MNDKRLSNRIALITGGTTGIGLATAKRFAAEGAEVIVTGRNPETLAAARRELGDTVKVVESDAANAQSVARLFQDLERDHGRLDILFLNAGIARFAPLADASVADFDDMWNVNVRGLWLAMQHALPLLAEGAAVIVNTSVVNQKGFEAASAYGATKAALRSIVRIAARELAGRNVRVNAISPGPIQTPIFGKLGMPEASLNEFLTNAVTHIPLGRMGTADEVASAAAFLASRDSSFITGSELAVDGGMAQM